MAEGGPGWAPPDSSLVSGVQISSRSGLPSLQGKDKHYKLAVGVVGGAAEADRAVKMTRLDKKRHAKAAYRQKALSIIMPFYQEAKAKVAQGQSLEELSEKERVALKVIAEDEKWEAAEALEREAKPPKSWTAEERALLEWKVRRHKELTRSQPFDPAKRESKYDIIAKNEWLRSVLLTPARQVPERFDLSWKVAPDADLDVEKNFEFDDWDVRTTPRELQRLDAVLRKSDVPFSEGVYELRFVPKVGPRKLGLHGGAADLVLQYIEGSRKAGAKRLAAAYSEAAVSEVLFRMLGARTNGGENAFQFGPCAEDWRPMGGADMIMTVPSPDAPPGSKDGRMVMVSVARAVSFRDAEQCSLVGMTTPELQKMMPRKLNKLHEQEVIGMSKLAVVLCPDAETSARVKEVYQSEREVNASKWSTVSMLTLVVDWAWGRLPDPVYCHCLGSVNYHTEGMWIPSQLKPVETWNEEKDAKAQLYHSTLFGIVRDDVRPGQAPSGVVP